MPDEEFDAPAAIERHPCPTCDVPAGLACRTGAGKTAAKYHTRRLQLVPQFAEELHILTPPDRGPGRRWQLGPEPGADAPAEPAPLAAGITTVRIGYARCSTATQKLKSQLDALEPICFQVFHEKVSTRVKVWPEYEKAVAMAGRCKEQHPQVQVILTVHEFRCPGRGTDLLVTAEELCKAGIALEFLTGPITGLYDPGDNHGQGAILIGVLAALSGTERTYTRERTLEAQESARKRGRTGGRPPSVDADQMEYALALRAKGTPMKEIQQKTVITRGRHKGRHPSLPTLYRTLAEAAQGTGHRAQGHKGTRAQGHDRGQSRANRHLPRHPPPQGRPVLQRLVDQPGRRRAEVHRVDRAHTAPRTTALSSSSRRRSKIRRMSSRHGPKTAAKFHEPRDRWSKHNGSPPVQGQTRPLAPSLTVRQKF
ncbi:recombinase family protein [Streptomyces spectabilis]|uniref:recombinase family protein n=1 Tax=Streptomyces spectabilis TaxID=68270 RepID=UPI0033F43C02